MKRLLLLAAFCALAAAMVPRERRAIEEVDMSTTTGAAVPNCAPLTPCGWIFYEMIPERVESTRNNDYCKCSANEVCIADEDDASGKNLIMRCKSPSSLKQVES